MERTGVQQAGRDRWTALKSQMERHPEVDWPYVYGLISELRPYSINGELDYETVDEMEAARLY